MVAITVTWESSTVFINVPLRWPFRQGSRGSIASADLKWALLWALRDSLCPGCALGAARGLGVKSDLSPALCTHWVGLTSEGSPLPDALKGTASSAHFRAAPGQVRAGLGWPGLQCPLAMPPVRSWAGPDAPSLRLECLRHALAESAKPPALCTGLPRVGTTSPCS